MQDARNSAGSAAGLPREMVQFCCPYLPAQRRVPVDKDGLATAALRRVPEGRRDCASFSPPTRLPSAHKEVGGRESLEVGV